MNIVFELCRCYLSDNDVQSLRLISKSNRSLMSTSVLSDPYYLAISKANTKGDIVLLTDYPEASRAYFCAKNIKLKVNLSFRNILYDNFKGVKIVDKNNNLLSSVEYDYKFPLPMVFTTHYYSSLEEKNKIVSSFKDCVVITHPFHSTTTTRKENVVFVDYDRFSRERVLYHLLNINNSYMYNCVINVHRVCFNSKMSRLSCRVLSLSLSNDLPTRKCSKKLAKYYQDEWTDNTLLKVLKNDIGYFDKQLTQHIVDKLVEEFNNN